MHEFITKIKINIQQEKQKKLPKVKLVKIYEKESGRYFS